MRKKVLVTLVSLTLTLSMLLGILVGCGGGAATPTAPGATVPGATVAPGATVPGATAAPTPAKAGEVYKWRFQSLSAAGAFNWWLQKEWADRIKIASGGRLIIDLLPAGSIVGYMEIPDAVSTGALEAGVAADAIMGGKNELFDLTGQLSANFMPQVLLAWYFYGTPDEPLTPKNYGRWWTEGVWKKYFNMYWIPMSPGISETEYLSQKPLFRPADYKGLKYRGLAYTAKLVAEFGAAPIFIPAPDVFSSIQTGVIDALELGNPASNEATGLHDVVKYMGFPGIHTLSQTTGVGIYLPLWEKLPDDLKLIVELATNSFTLRNYMFGLVESVKVMDKVLAKGKPIVTYLSVEMQEAMWKASFRLMDAQAAASKFPEFKPMWEDIKKFQYSMDRYIDLQTPDFGPTYPGRKENFTGIKFQ